MLRHCFTCTEAAGDSSRTALCNRENGVDYSLSRDKRFNGRQSFLNRSRVTDRPFLTKGKLFNLARVGFKLDNCIVYRVFAVGSNLSYLARNVRRHHSLMCDYIGFGALGKNISARKTVSHLCLYGNGIFLFRVKRAEVCAPADERSEFLFNFGQRSFDTVKDIAENSRAERNAHGRACRNNRFAGFKSRSFLINLNRGKIGVNLNYLSDKSCISDINRFHHFKVGLTFYGNDRAVNAEYFIFLHNLALLISSSLNFR